MGTWSEPKQFPADNAWAWSDFAVSSRQRFHRKLAVRGRASLCVELKTGKPKKGHAKNHTVINWYQISVWSCCSVDSEQSVDAFVNIRRRSDGRSRRRRGRCSWRTVLQLITFRSSTLSLRLIEILRHDAMIKNRNIARQLELSGYSNRNGELLGSDTVRSTRSHFIHRRLDPIVVWLK